MVKNNNKKRGRGGEFAMLLIVLYHFLEINANKTDDEGGKTRWGGDRKEVVVAGGEGEDEAQKGTNEASETGATRRGAAGSGVELARVWYGGGLSGY